jgi:glycosyltransferase involved in cell wall biosynthesis
MKAYLDGPPSSFLNIAITHSLASYLEISKGDYDLIHDHTWKEGLSCASFISTPIVHTIHGPFDEENKRFYSLFKRSKKIGFVTISNFQQACFPWLNYLATVYNAIDTSKYPYSKEKEDFFLYLGRFNSEKAPHLACKAVKKLGGKLILAGKINEQAEKDYFNGSVKSYLNKDIRYLGEVSERKKMGLLSKAKGYLFSIQWDEPFGITLIEAMACGTPVITFKRGATPEIVEHEVTGYVVKGMDEFIRAMKRIDEINPKRCRERIEKLFSLKSMINGYERAYTKILKNK